MNHSSVGRVCALSIAASLLVASLANVAQGQSKPAASAPAGERVALVIGNAAYKQSPLANPVNDATDMAAALRTVGFRVITRHNADRRAMREAFDEFATALRRAQVGLFYFAGHGVQVRGSNYLIPLGADIKSEADVEIDAVDANYALRTMEEAQAKVSILILDACRDNPFARTFRSASRGLAEMRGATGSFIAFATAPGTQASDGKGRNGIYTKHLLASLREPDTDISKVFQRTRAEVVRETGGKQTPWEATSLIGDFSFRAPLEASASTSTGTTPGSTTTLNAPSSQDAELVFWASIQNSRDPHELNAYLEQYPNGRFAGLARARLKGAEAAKPPPTQVASGVSATPPATPPAGSLQSMQPGTVFGDCEGCPEMVVIPPGRFVMGSPANEEGRFNNESPQREVAIPRVIAVGKFEITRGQFERFAQEENRPLGDGCFALISGKWEKQADKNRRNPGFPQTDDHPVVCVDWNDARAYVAWLSRKSGKTYRLLTEAEWEYAARATATSARYWGEGFNPDGCRYANIADATAKQTFSSWTNAANCSDNHVYTAPTGRFLPNRFGLHDMLGNVWEWVEDCWNENYNGAPNDGSAWTSGDCSQRVLRVGAWYNDPRFARTAFRVRHVTAFRGSFGFRVARTDF
ncbi:MAG: SUMF1/EgtB/PvdO family nonheme iron enzyme [Burkholderiales bacterium]